MKVRSYCDPGALMTTDHECALVCDQPNVFWYDVPKSTLATTVLSIVTVTLLTSPASYAVSWTDKPEQLSATTGRCASAEPNVATVTAPAAATEAAALTTHRFMFMNPSLSSPWGPLVPTLISTVTTQRVGRRDSPYSVERTRSRTLWKASSVSHLPFGLTKP